MTDQLKAQIDLAESRESLPDGLPLTMWVTFNGNLVRYCWDGRKRAYLEVGGAGIIDLANW